jgi:predicted metalloendopeptidase
LSFNAETDKLIVYNYNYVSNAARIFKKAAMTNRRALENLLIWSLIKNSVRFLPVKFGQLESALFMNMQPQQSDRTESCTTETVQNFVYAVSRVYVERYFNRSIKAKVEEMFVDLRQVFKAILNASQWTDEYSREKAIEKVMKLN